MDVEIGDESSDESLRGNQQIDAALGTRPSAETAPASEPNAEQTASDGIPPTVAMPGILNPEIGRNDFPVESLHLMNETLTTHALEEWPGESRSVCRTVSNGHWQGCHESLAATG